MSDLLNYANTIVSKARRSFASCEIFAKVLTHNDDSGRHGVLIPADAYPFFPHFPIPDPKVNATLQFSAFNSIAADQKEVAYKYYERYPERRITRLSPLLNALHDSPRMLVFLRARHPDGSLGYYFDCADSSSGGRFKELFDLIFGEQVGPVPGHFVIRPVDSEPFHADPVLGELLDKFDTIKSRGWIDSLRSGDTGIGYTFETLLGIEENNDQQADFKGIELKCKGTREGEASASTKINLFQAGPRWLAASTARQRIRILGRRGEDGLFTCYSQVTATPNNLDLLLDILYPDKKIHLRKSANALAYWSFAQLGKRLAEKHSRAAFVTAQVRKTRISTQYAYEHLVYCDTPSIDRFVSLVGDRNIVFEFTMSEKPDGTIRNHGYPWRLIRAGFLDQLFAFQIQLR